MQIQNPDFGEKSLSTSYSRYYLAMKKCFLPIFRSMWAQKGMLQATLKIEDTVSTCRHFSRPTLYIDICLSLLVSQAYFAFLSPLLSLKDKNHLTLDQVRSLHKELHIRIIASEGNCHGFFLTNFYFYSFSNHYFLTLLLNMSVAREFDFVIASHLSLCQMFTLLSSNKAPW